MILRFPRQASTPLLEGFGCAVVVGTAQVAGIEERDVDVVDVLGHIQPVEAFLDKY